MERSLWSGAGAAIGVLAQAAGAAASPATGVAAERAVSGASLSWIPWVIAAALIALLIELHRRILAANARLRSSEELYRKVFDSSPIQLLISTLDDGRILEVNNRVAEGLGCRREDVVGRTADDLGIATDPAWRKAVADRLAAGGTVRNMEVTVRTTRWGDRTLLYSAELITFRNAPCLLSLIHDITDRKAVEEALRAGEARYRSLVESQEDLFARVDTEGRLTYVNDALCRKFGQSRDAVLGRNVSELVSGESRAEIQRGLDSLRHPPYRTTAEYRSLTKDGVRWIAWEGTAIRDPQGRVIEFQGVGRDVTDRITSERALRRRAREMAFLNHVITAANEAAEIDPLLRETLHAALRLLDMEMGGIYLIEPDGRAASLRCSVGLPEDLAAERSRLLVDDGLIAGAISGGRPMVSDPCERDDPVGAARWGLRSAIAVPLFSHHHRVLGVLCLAARVHRGFSADEQDLLMSIGRDVGTAAARIQEEETHRRNDRLLESAVSAGMLLLASPDYRAAVAAALELLGRAADADRAFLLEVAADSPPSGNAPLFSENVFQWISPGAELPNEPLNAPPPPHLRFSGLEQVLTDGRPIHGPIEDLPEPIRSRLAARAVRSLFAAPIHIHGRFWGMMVLSDCRRPRLWGDHERAILTAAANTLGSAVVRGETQEERELDARELERSNRQIRNEKRRTELILEGITDGVVAVDLDARVVQFNRAAQSLLGVEGGVAVGESLPRVLARSPLDPASARLLCEGGATPRFPLATGGADPRTVDVAWADYYEMSGARAGRVFILRDTTREREIDRMKTQFVSSVSHELRTPLTSIKGFTDTLLHDPAMPPETRATFLRIIAEETARLTALIENILDLSRIESGRAVHDFRAVDLRRVTDRLVPLILPDIERKALDFGVEIPADLPPLRAEVDSLQTILNNLLSNAVKFTPRGGRIRLRARATEDAVVVEVADNGIGIAERDLPRIFERFYRAHPPEMEIPGTGLGLAIVQEITRRHGGRVSVESALGQGSTFAVTLPRHPARADAATPCKEGL